MQIQRCPVRGFTRIDASFIVVALLLLAAIGWAGIGAGRNEWQSSVCARHMTTLGQAFTAYAHDHDGALPAAMYNDGHTSNTWDVVIAGYLLPPAGNKSSPLTADQQKQIAYLFQCPADHEPRWVGTPRSYSMPIYDINLANWPPDVNSLGGLGLSLDRRTLRKAHAVMPPEQAKTVPAITTSMVPAPTDTALLVECVNSINVLWQSPCACIASTDDQFKANTFKVKDFHGGKMNYLMLDGHVETMLPVQSGGHLASGDQGVWTIRPGD
ncbi:MAG TPA: H-X9-DG-CTERM domain-containing protein [Verrucomicrobiae bacterium]